MTIYKGGEPYQISRRSVRIAFNYTDGAKFSYDSGYDNYITAPLYAWKSYWDYVKLDSGGGDTPVETATISVSLTNATCNLDTGTEYNVGSTVAIIVTPMPVTLSQQHQSITILLWLLLVMVHIT